MPSFLTLLPKKEELLGGYLIDVTLMFSSAVFMVTSSIFQYMEYYLLIKIINYQFMQREWISRMCGMTIDAKYIKYKNIVANP